MGEVGLKICGVTRVADLETCMSLGVDAVGINLWPASRRGLTIPAAKRLLAAVPTSEVQRVGVFVDRSPSEVRDAASQLGLDAIQWHGDADPRPYAALGRPWVWVIRGTPALAELDVPAPAPTWILLDAAVAGYGGAGTRTDWAWAARAVQWLAPLPVWLAGGITPSNAADAIGQVGPAGLDVASGAEVVGADHGEKDPRAVAQLRSATRG